MACLGDEARATEKECGWPLEARKSKGMDSPLELPEGSTVC